MDRVPRGVPTVFAGREGSWAVSRGEWRAWDLLSVAMVEAMSDLVRFRRRVSVVTICRLDSDSLHIRGTAILPFSDAEVSLNRDLAGLGWLPTF